MALGVEAKVMRAGENVRIAWVGSGANLALVLTQVKTPTGEATRVHLDYDVVGKPDVIHNKPGLNDGLKILADLEARHGKAA
jgi:hypothetical protein